MEPITGIIVSVLVVALILITARYKQLESEYQCLQRDIRGLYEIAHFPEDMWLPSKEWGEWTWAAMNRTGYLK